MNEIVKIRAEIQSKKQQKQTKKIYKISVRGRAGSWKRETRLTSL